MRDRLKQMLLRLLDAHWPRGRASPEFLYRYRMHRMANESCSCSGPDGHVLCRSCWARRALVLEEIRGGR